MLLAGYIKFTKNDREEIMAIINLKLQRTQKASGAKEKSSLSADAENDGIVAV